MVLASQGPWDLSHLKTHIDSTTNTTKAIITNTSTNTPTKTATTNGPKKTATTKTALPDQLAAAPGSHSHRDSSSQVQVLSCIDEQGVSCKVDARCIITTTGRASDDTASATDCTPCEDTTTPPPTKATISDNPLPRPPTAKATSQEQHCRSACNMQQQQQSVVKQQQPPSYGFGAWAGRLNEGLRSVRPAALSAVALPPGSDRVCACHAAVWESDALGDLA